MLFAHREIPNDSLKFSSFELLYTRRARDPLSILHKLWTKNQLYDELKNTRHYVLDLRSQLEHSAKLESDNAAVNNKLYKTFLKVMKS